MKRTLLLVSVAALVGCSGGTGGGSGGGSAGGGSAGGGSGGGGPGGGSGGGAFDAGPSCDAVSCPAGCCQGTTCRAGDDNAACGKQGAACAACASPQRCQANACAAPVIGDPCKKDSDCSTGLKCDESVPEGYCLQACTAANTCPANAACIGGGRTGLDGSPLPAICLKACAADTACRVGYSCAALLGVVTVCIPKCLDASDCESGVCDISTGKCGALGNVGKACLKAADCGADLLCATGATVPGGYCSRSCGQEASCPTGSECFSVGDSDTACLLECTTAAQCRAGYDCFGGGCTPKCTSNAGCGFGEQCELATGKCVEAGVAARAIGSACKMNSDCDSNACLEELTTLIPGGMCSLTCTAATCPAGSVCAGTGPNAICTVPCTATAACRDGWKCSNFQGASNVCVPACSKVPSVCTATEVCLPSGACAPTPASTPIVAETAMALPMLSVPFIDDGASTPVIATVPDGGVSVQVVIDGPSTANLRVSKVSGPGGVLYQLGALGQSTLKLFNVSESGSMAVMVPNSPDVPFPPGDYEFEFTSVKNQVVNVTPSVNIKSASDPAITQATMDITFVFVGAHAVIADAAAAQADADFQTMVTTFKSVFAAGGVTVGNIEYLDASAAVAMQHADLANGALGALVRTTAALPNERVTVFWVQSIAGGGPGFTLLGQSAGIPGGLKKGSGVAGVVMSLGDFPNGFDNPTRIGRTLTHEFGHWLGLFHATERGGTAFDPLTDTLECDEATFDANSDNVLTPAECVQAGSDNLMFWTQDLAVVARNKLSPNQQWVLLRNPAAD